MTDSKTKWRAKPMIGEPSGKWWYVWAGDDVVARYLDKPTAIKIAAANEIVQTGEALAHYYAKSLNVGPGPQPMKEALLWSAFRAALSKARGEDHE